MENISDAVKAFIEQAINTSTESLKKFFDAKCSEINNNINAKHKELSKKLKHVEQIARDANKTALENGKEIENIHMREQ